MLLDDQVIWPETSRVPAEVRGLVPPKVPLIVGTSAVESSPRRARRVWPFDEASASLALHRLFPVQPDGHDHTRFSSR